MGRHQNKKLLRNVERQARPTRPALPKLPNYPFAEFFSSQHAAAVKLRKNVRLLDALDFLDDEDQGLDLGRGSNLLHFCAFFGEVYEDDEACEDVAGDLEHAVEIALNEMHHGLSGVDDEELSDQPLSGQDDVEHRAFALRRGVHPLLQANEDNLLPADVSIKFWPLSKVAAALQSHYVAASVTVADVKQQVFIECWVLEVFHVMLARKCASMVLFAFAFVIPTFGGDLIPWLLWSCVAPIISALVTFWMLKDNEHKWVRFCIIQFAFLANNTREQCPLMLVMQFLFLILRHPRPVGWFSYWLGAFYPILVSSWLLECQACCLTLPPWLVLPLFLWFAAGSLKSLLWKWGLGLLIAYHNDTYQYEPDSMSELFKGLPIRAYLICLLPMSWPSALLCTFLYSIDFTNYKIVKVSFDVFLVAVLSDMVLWWAQSFLGQRVAPGDRDQFPAWAVDELLAEQQVRIRAAEARQTIEQKDDLEAQIVQWSEINERMHAAEERRRKKMELKLKQKEDKECLRKEESIAKMERLLLEVEQCSFMADSVDELSIVSNYLSCVHMAIQEAEANNYGSGLVSRAHDQISRLQATEKKIKHHAAAMQQAEQQERARHQEEKQAQIAKELREQRAAEKLRKQMEKQAEKQRIQEEQEKQHNEAAARAREEQRLQLEEARRQKEEEKKQRKAEAALRKQMREEERREAQAKLAEENARKAIAEQARLKELANAEAAEKAWKEEVIACDLCMLSVKRCDMKWHKRNDCEGRLVRCWQCEETDLAFRDLAVHQRLECNGRPVRCDQCQNILCYRDLNRHRELDCPFRQMSCSNQSRGCTWKGACIEMEAHEVLCPFTLAVCEWCFEERWQFEMPSHTCPKIREDDCCVVCMESFHALQQQNVPAVILLTGSKRTCSHISTCRRCAEDWGLRAHASAACPVCRNPFTSIVALPSHLMLKQTGSSSYQPLEDVQTLHMSRTSAQRPLPPPGQMLVGTTWFVSPLDIRFTHDSISERFRPFRKNGEIRSLSILDSIGELLLPQEEPQELEIIDVVWHDGLLYVAGSYNRRLCMYRLLAIFAAERFGLIKVRILCRDEPKLRFWEKLTTRCEGLQVEVRPGRKVGVHEEDVDWDEARMLLGMLLGGSCSKPQVKPTVSLNQQVHKASTSSQADSVTCRAESPRVSLPPPPCILPPPPPPPPPPVAKTRSGTGSLAAAVEMISPMPRCLSVSRREDITEGRRMHLDNFTPSKTVNPQRGKDNDEAIDKQIPPPPPLRPPRAKSRSGAGSLAATFAERELSVSRREHIKEIRSLLPPPVSKSRSGTDSLAATVAERELISPMLRSLSLGRRERFQEDRAPPPAPVAKGRSGTGSLAAGIAERDVISPRPRSLSVSRRQHIKESRRMHLDKFTPPQTRNPQRRKDNNAALDEQVAHFALEALVGKWRDGQGSVYTLVVSSRDSCKLDVHTVRPNGEEHWTPGLIRIEHDSRSWSIAWGRSYVLEDTPLSCRVASSVYWVPLSKGRKHFAWSRVDS